jgi:diacylglycerol kinase (ATP)
MEWIACILCIGSVITAELINTAIESTIDLYTQEQHPLAKKAKDVAAGAVLACAITAAIIGLMIFFPKALDLILSLFTE